MIITIGGQVGAGKTTLATRLTKALGYPALNMGGLMREMAAERGMTIDSFYSELKKEPDLERVLDHRQANTMHTQDNLVVQGRLAWFFAKGSPFKIFNILLMVDSEIGAKRTGDRPENAGRELGELFESNAQRTRDELERYRELYYIDDFLDRSHYDFVLDTTTLSEEEVLQKVLASLPK